MFKRNINTKRNKRIKYLVTTFLVFATGFIIYEILGSMNSLDNENKFVSFILFGCLALGELIVRVLDIKLPASIVGMLILTLLLKLKVIKLEWVRGLTDFLIANLGFFFVPPGVALMCYFDLIRAEALPIVVATIVSTMVVLLITGHTHQMGLTAPHHALLKGAFPDQSQDLLLIHIIILFTCNVNKLK